MTDPTKPRAWERFFRSPRMLRREVDQELAFHLEMRTRELEREGLSHPQARAEALRRFGDLEATRNACLKSDQRRERRKRRTEGLAEIVQDLGHGIRQLRRRPAFSAAAVLTLALGIGATTVIVSAADHVVIRPLPYLDSERVMTLWEGDRSTGEDRKGVSPGNFLEWRDRASSFGSLALAEPFAFDLTGEGPPESLSTWLVSEEFLEALGVTPVIGRNLVPEEFLPGGPSAVLLSHGLWEGRFGGDSTLVGGTIQLDGVATVVAGVLPAWLEYPGRRALYAPKRFTESEAADRRSSYMYGVARLRAGVTPAEAGREMARIAEGLAQEFPQTNANATVEVVPLEDRILGDVRPALLILLGAAGFLLLIACANVAGLLLARGVEREREFAVRGALGAGRSRLFRQLITESSLLACCGGLAGMVLAWYGMNAVAGLLPPELPRVGDVRIDARVLGLVTMVSLLTALLFGGLPALRLSRPDLEASLRGGGRSSGGARGRSRLRSGLVVGQIGLALVLLVGAGLLMRSFVHLMENDLGFVPEDRVAMQLFIWDNNPTAPERVQRVEEISERLRATPGVREVGAVTALPFHPTQITARSVFRRQGEPAPRPGEEERVFVTAVSPEYFRAMEIPLRSGRAFTSLDRVDAVPVATVNETLARRLFPGETPVGQRIVLGPETAPLEREIVGVVGDVRPTALDSEPRSELYVPHAQSGGGGITFVIQAGSAPAALVPQLVQQVFEVDPRQSIGQVSTLEELVASTLVERRFHLALLGGFSVIALLLAAVGIYGLISYTTGQRMREIGIRMALGARPKDILALVLAQGTRLGLSGVALGVLGALLLTRLMSHMLYGVRPTDPVTFGQVAGLMLLIALLGAILPARRAAAADPNEALRGE